MNLFKLVATVGLDTKEYDKNVKEADKKGKGLAKTLGHGLGGAVKVGGKAMVAAAKATVVGVSTMATAVGGLIAKSTQEFADYEQLVGGSQLLFGEAYSTIKGYAETAYRDVQMSQNEYLRQVNGFATGLKTALEGNELAAADLANKIIRAEADVVAATGNSQEAVQNAFNGIMKSNFTMLDNLQLGITPTKEGFQSLIDKVNEWNAENGKFTKYTIDNVADCQAALVDYIEMQGLSGYAAAEASDTISGSWASVKASFSDLLAGMSDDKADMDKLIDNLVVSIEAYANNLGPVVKTALGHAGDVLMEYGPKVADMLPEFLDETLPRILGYGGNFVGKIADGIYSHSDEIQASVEKLVDKFGDGVEENGPGLIVKGAIFLGKILAGFSDAIPALTGKIPDIADGLSEEAAAHKEEFKAIGRQILTNVGEGIKDLGGYLWDLMVASMQPDGRPSPQPPGIPGAGRPVFRPQSNPTPPPTRPNRLPGSNRPRPGGMGPSWVHGTHATGLDYVPFDGYIAELHKGERVLTAEENKRPGVTIIQNIYSQAKTAADLMAEARYKQEEAIFTGV